MKTAKRLKFLVLSPTSDLLGGAERSMLDLFDAWVQKHDFEVKFIIREPLGALTGQLKRRGWSYIPMKFTFWAYLKPPVTDEEVHTEYLTNSRAVKKIEMIIQQTQPDIIMTNTIVSPWAALAAYPQKVPHVWFVREYGDLDRKFTLTHDQTYEDVGSLSNLVVANSETLARHIKKYVGPDKVTTLYNPFDLTTIAKLANLRVSNPYRYPDSLKLIITGNIAPLKGQLNAVEAVGLLNRRGLQTELCLVGKSVDLPYHERIKTTIYKYGLEDKVHLVGFQADALAFARLADVGIVASGKEGFGRTTFEYLAIAKPVVGTEEGATKEMVQPAVNGYLYKPGDSQQLAELLTNYIKKPALIKKHGAAAKHQAKTMLQSQHNSEALYAKIQLLANGKGAAKGRPIHLLSRLEKYQNRLGKPGSGAIHRTFRHRLRQTAKSNYYRARKIKAQLTGK